MPAHATESLGPVRSLVFCRLIVFFAVMVACPAAVRAQARIFSFCYVPLTGTVYRIKEADVRQTCASTAHVEFRITDGEGGGVSDHGSLAGLGDDDHSQYLLRNGVREATNGFAVTGTIDSGNLLVSGGGTRLLWYPAKAAFRAGRVLGTQWDDANIGRESLAIGFNASASGFRGSAIGGEAVASGDGSFAAGSRATASGGGAISIGGQTVASGLFATALGFDTEASGLHSTAMGLRASTNGHAGAFVYGDNSAFGLVVATTPNQFVVRAQHFWLGVSNSVTNPAGHFLTTSTGAFLSTGGAWTNVSDLHLKYSFRDVDADDVLSKIGALQVQSWSYKAEEPSIRHIGPTAQDFRAAFGLGNAETSIATVDADGVSLLGIQALLRRSLEQERRLESLRAENAELRTRLHQVEAVLKRLDQR